MQEPNGRMVPKRCETHERDLVGYGGRPVHPDWPHDARIAVSFVINYEEGGEYSIPAGDDISETYLAEVVWGGPAPDGFRFLGSESIYDYGARAGVWRLREMFKQRGLVPSSHEG